MCLGIAEKFFFLVLLFLLFPAHMIRKPSRKPSPDSSSRLKYAGEVKDLLSNLHARTVIPAMTYVDSRYKDLFTFIEEGEYMFMKKEDKFLLMRSDFWKTAERKNEDYYGIIFPGGMAKSYGKYVSKPLKRLFPGDTTSTFIFKIGFSRKLSNVKELGDDLHSFGPDH